MQFSGPRLVDGPMGTELGARGVRIDGPSWSAEAIAIAPEVIAAIHRDYAAAGAVIHRTNTFRTRPSALGSRWRGYLDEAVAIARRSVPAHHEVWGSIAPARDCYRPDLADPGDWPEHAVVAAALAEAGVDAVLCETFPHPDEAVAATTAAVATGLPVWTALTAGPDAGLLTPDALAEAGRRCLDVGARGVLVNCTAASRIAPYATALAALGAPWGLLPNAGPAAEGLGWTATPDLAALDRRLDAWLALRPQLLGLCCGFGPVQVAHLARRLDGAGAGRGR